MVINEKKKRKDVTILIVLRGEFPILRIHISTFFHTWTMSSNLKARKPFGKVTIPKESNSAL